MKMQLKKQANKQKGFTLVELMIVVAIIGILAAIAIPQFAAYRTRSMNANAKALNKNVVGTQADLNSELGCYGQTNNVAANLTIAVPGALVGAGNVMSSNSTPTLASAASATTNGSRLEGFNSGSAKQFSVPLGIGANMILFSNTPTNTAALVNESTSYIIITRHMNGDSAYGVDSDVPNTLYSVSNATWPGNDGMQAAIAANVQTGNNQFDLNNIPGDGDELAGNGAPSANWAPAQ